MQSFSLNKKPILTRVNWPFWCKSPRLLILTKPNNDKLIRFDIWNILKLKSNDTVILTITVSAESLSVLVS